VQGGGVRGIRAKSLAALVLIAAVLVSCQKTDSTTEGAAPGPERERQGAAGSAPPATDAKALAVAERVMRALGGDDAWRSTRYVSWHFFEVRRHHWDRQTGDVRIEANDVVILMNLGTKQGRVQKAGAEVTDPAELASYLERGYAWWVNDSYWMFMPYKLRDPGVHLAYAGERQLGDTLATEVLTLTFENVGLTPRNKYDVFVSRETGLVAAWAYYPDRDDPEPKFTSPWSGWQRFGGILLATDHGQGKNWDIRVYDTLPESVFDSFEAVRV
jgi:hypothetical protein